MIHMVVETYTRKIVRQGVLCPVNYVSMQDRERERGECKRQK